MLRCLLRDTQHHPDIPIHQHPFAPLLDHQYDDVDPINAMKENIDRAIHDEATWDGRGRDIDEFHCAVCDVHIRDHAFEFNSVVRAGEDTWCGLCVFDPVILAGIQDGIVHAVVRDNNIDEPSGILVKLPDRNIVLREATAETMVSP